MKKGDYRIILTVILSLCFLLINKNYLENKNICIYYKCSLIKALSFIDRNKFNCFYVLNECIILS